MQQLGEYCTEPVGSPNYIVNRVIDMYTHCTHDKLITQFLKPSPLRVIIATIAFGMGINCPDAEMYIQETGRAGRDGKLCC